MKKSAVTILLLLTLQLVPAGEFEIREEAAFKKIVAPDAKVQKLAGDMKFTEGPVWLNTTNGGYLIFSDIPSNELKKWSPTNGLTTFRSPSLNVNGNTLDREGRLISCEHSGRRLSILQTVVPVAKSKDVKLRSTPKEVLVTLVDRYDGKKFNSPNDAVVKSDGTVWFTDPPYGLPKGDIKEMDGHYVFRFDPKTKSTTLVAKDFDMPNGLCFSADEKKLYVADSGKPKHIRAFDVQADGTLKGGEVFCKIDKGGPDGIRCDAEGQVWSSAGDGVHIFAPDGKLIGKILMPEAPANLCFGGADGKTLFITARTSLYSIPVLVKGGN